MHNFLQWGGPAEAVTGACLSFPVTESTKSLSKLPMTMLTHRLAETCMISERMLFFLNSPWPAAQHLWIVCLKSPDKNYDIVDSVMTHFDNFLPLLDKLAWLLFFL